MNLAQTTTDCPATDDVPGELLELLDRIRAMPPAVRAELEPYALDVIEQARFRTRVLAVARDGLEQMRLELSLARFDLDVTRREREDWKRSAKGQ